MPARKPKNESKLPRQESAWDEPEHEEELGDAMNKKGQSSPRKAPQMPTVRKTTTRTGRKTTKAGGKKI